MFQNILLKNLAIVRQFQKRNTTKVLLKTQAWKAVIIPFSLLFTKGIMKFI